MVNPSSRIPSIPVLFILLLRHAQETPLSWKYAVGKSHQLSADQKLITNDQQSIKNDQLQMVSGKLLFWLRFIENWLRINEKWLKCLIDKPNFFDQLHKWKKVN